MAKSLGFLGLFVFLAIPYKIVPLVAAPHFAPPLNRPDNGIEWHDAVHDHLFRQN
ncbi:MAG: hypothetical protein ABSA26_02590 [Thermoguttaceae bacterium]